MVLRGYNARMPRFEASVLKHRVEILLECRADVLRRLFALIAMHASEVSDIRLARRPGPNMGCMKLELEIPGNPRDLHCELLLEPSVHEVSIL